MSFGWTSGYVALSRQAKAVRRLHVIFGSMLMLATLGLVSTTSFGTQLFQSKESKHSSGQTSSFSHIKAASPLPLLLNDGTEPSEVHVKGEQITSDSDFPDSDSQTNDLGINNNQFIHSFSFATIYRESSTSISATWNTQAGKGSYLYVIRVSHNGIRNISDEQIYSIEGAGLGNDTESFEYEKVLSGGLYLTVSQLLSDGSYKLIESTGIATD